MTALPHVFVQLTCLIDDGLVKGVAADGLIPKWFTKDPDSNYEDDISEMLDVIQAACQFAQNVGTVTSPFDLWQAVYIRQHAWGIEKGYPPLLWGFGLSLVERAMIDAYCRATEIPFSVALRSNLLAMQLDEIHPELAGFQPADLLPIKPLEQVHVRHTVGLTDPLLENEIPEYERINDGLPQSLEANLKIYGITYLKVKLSGEERNDFERLKRIDQLLQNSGLTQYGITLDGNEQFKSVSSFQNYWQALNSIRDLEPLLGHLLYVEQPLHRDVALCPTTQEPLRGWTERPLMIIDESDSELDSIKIALDCGYIGTSHKNCKGIFKGIANACLLEHKRREEGNKTYILSGEDLANIGPIALLQDLTMMSILGIPHIERNGHHYFKGLSMFADEIQEQITLSHPDLYQRNENEFATLQINSGMLQLKSVIQSPFGVNTVMDPSKFFTPIQQWRYLSLYDEVPNYSI